MVTFAPAPAKPSFAVSTEIARIVRTGKVATPEMAGDEIDRRRVLADAKAMSPA